MITAPNIFKVAQDLNGYNYNNQLVLLPCTQYSVSKIKKSHMDNENITFGHTTFILVLSGSIDININYITHKFEKNMWIVISSSSTIKIENATPDFMSYILSFSEAFVIDTILDRKPIPSNRFVDIKETPGTLITNEQTNSLKYSIDRIFYYMRLSEHNFLKDMLHNTFYNLILEISNIYLDIDNQKERKKVIPRKDMLVHQFMTLVHKYADKEHSPSYYANQLCISTQYLSLILKEVSGKTASDWIAVEIISRAKALLRTPGTTLAQVADSLHFADQSTFGKFFKKNTGITPKKYKDSYAVPE